MRKDPFSRYSPEIISTVMNMRLLDDNLMNKVFESKECVELTLRIILNIPTLRVLRVRTQSTVHNLQGRSTRFDVWATDSKGTQYDIEVQRSDKGAGCMRARYNSAMMDSNITEPGDQCDKLPQTYVIFITENDVLGCGQLCYNIDRMFWNEQKQQYEKFEDDAHIVYVNAAYPDFSTKLGRLMADFRAISADKMFFEPLKNRVRFFKENVEGVEQMCKAVEILQQQGFRNGQVQAIIKLVSKGKLSIDEAADELGISSEKVRQYLNGESKV